jgi:hypothetical protein
MAFAVARAWRVAVTPAVAAALVLEAFRVFLDMLLGLERR